MHLEEQLDEVMPMFKTFKEAQAHHKTLGIDPGDPLSTSIEEARAQQDRYFNSLLGELPEVSKVLDETVSSAQGPVSIRLTYPKSKGPFNYILFIRGAGWWAGGLDSHTQTTASLANRSGCVVCAVDYYKTPGYAYPTQVEQVIDVLKFLASRHAQFDLKGMPFLFGESAGSTIALSVAQRLRDQQQDALEGLILFYCNAGGFKPTARKYSQWVWEQYIGPGQPLDQNDAVPLQGNLGGLPRVWMAVGEDDPLIVDTQKLNDQLIQSGAKPILNILPGLPHGFLMWTATLEPALNALERAAEWIKAGMKSP